MSDEQPRLTRQQLYERIQASSKEEFILEEMKRLGFWDVTEEIPQASEALRQERKGLSEELAKLLEKQRIYNDRQTMLREMRKARMAAALAKRAETKDKRQAKREAKAAAWAERKQQEILYLGQGVSGGLSQTQADEAKLQALGLPLLPDAAALAAHLGISLSELRFLAYRRQVSRLSHYRRFSLPKKTGGLRHISAPMPRLKAAQEAVLQKILYQLSFHEAAHGFVPGQSILSNALPHVGAKVLVNLDLRDFFPSIAYPRVKGLFRALGYAEAIAIPLALLCTEPQSDIVQLDGQTFYVAQDKNVLPQGAPSSPAITNLLCRRMDQRFKGLAKKMGWTYTRYADDLSFSSSTGTDLNGLLFLVKKIIKEEGFTLHPDKLHVMRPGQRKEVTGVVVNEKPSVSRDKLKRFRSLLHKIEKGERQGLYWGEGALGPSILGFANFVAMVDPTKGKALLDKVKGLMQAHPWLKQSGGKAAAQVTGSSPQAPSDNPTNTETAAETPSIPKTQAQSWTSSDWWTNW